MWLTSNGAERGGGGASLAVARKENLASLDAQREQHMRLQAPNTGTCSRDLGMAPFFGRTSCLLGFRGSGKPSNLGVAGLPDFETSRYICSRQLNSTKATTLSSCPLGAPVPEDERRELSRRQATSAHPIQMGVAQN